MCWRRALWLGAASWLIPLVVSVPLFPLKQANALLFGNVMALVVVLTAAALLHVYFRARAVSIAEAIIVGVLWAAINLVLDYPMFAYGPMQMTIGRYYSEIGIVYLLIPAFAFGAAWLASVTKPEALLR